MCIKRQTYERPAEVPALIGVADKANQYLSWKPRSDWRDVARIMTEADIALLDTLWEDVKAGE